MLFSTTRVRLLLLLVLLAIWQHPALAQQPQPRPLDCGTRELTDQQKRDLDAAAKFAFQIKKAQNNKAFTGITYVPIRPHILRRSDGTGGMSVASLNKVMGLANKYFMLNNSGVQFYLAGTAPDYIDDDTGYNAATIPNGRDATNALNMYFTPSGGGYAYYPYDDVYATRSVIGTSGGDDYTGGYLIPHELGHNFNLIHTFEGNSSTTAELVTRGAGANCSYAGDLVCDTPADPYNLPGATFTYNSAGCQIYTGTVRDANGELYNPQMGNQMSYYSSLLNCPHYFTAGQYDRMQAGLALRQSYTNTNLTYAPVAVTAPGNLSATLTTGGSAQLTWQDNATNELGYFVERSTSATDGFGAIGGVGPNVTAFTDQGLTSNTVYYYRIRPSNATTGSLSTVRSVTTAAIACRPTYTIGCGNNDGLNSLIINRDTLSWYSGCSGAAGYQEFTQRKTTLYAYQSYSFSARLLSANNAGFAIWIDANRDGIYDAAERIYQRSPATGDLVAGDLIIPATVTAGPVGMRVMTVAGATPDNACGSYLAGETEDYTLNIITTCPATTNLTTVAVSTAGAQLAWANAGDGLRYDLQWRQPGSTTWTTISDLPRPTYALTGLQLGTAYEWQVKTVCAPVSSAGYSGSATFTTRTTCEPPTSLTTRYPGYTSIQFGWVGVGPGVTYDLRYKPQNSQTWQTIANLPYTDPGMPLTNPSAVTIYNWGVRTNCGSVGSTSFVDGPDFTLLCPTPTSLTTTARTVNSAQLNWQSYSGLTAPNTLQWRIAGVSAWNSVTGITTNSYSLTGLQRGTVYEWRVGSICTAISQSNYAGPVTFITTGCQPTFAYGCNYGDGVNSFTFNGVELSRNSGCAASSYSQFTAVTATVSPGRSYSFAGTLLSQSTQEGITGWVDLNRNGDFEPSEARYFPSYQAATGLFTGALSIPVGTATGPLVLRLILTGGALPASACGSYYYGETEDYLLNVVPATTCVLPTLTLSGSVVTAPGGYTTVSIAQTGDVPYSFTIANSAGEINSAYPSVDYPLPNYYVNPYGTTVYFPLSVSNACGVGTVSGSATVVVQNCEPPTGLFESEKTLSSIRLNWQPSAVASKYNVRFREAGASSFTYYDTYGNFGNYSLYSLTYGKAYEWQVNTVCTNGSSTSYTAPRSFTMSCPEPYSLTEVASGASSVYLQWGYVGYPINFTVQYRLADTSPWTSATGLSSSTYYPTGWEAGQRYEWRVRTDCANGNSTAFSPSRFITVPCNAPTYLNVSGLTGSTAQLSWGYYTNTTPYELQWRLQQPINSPYSSATIITNSYSLTGLTAGAGYEYRVRTVCSASATSAFTAPYSFTPQCGAVNYQSAYNITSTGAVLQWSSPNYTSTYNLVYRVVGGPVSTTVSALTGTTFSVTGLSNSTAYEFLVQVICPDGSLSVFSTPFSFTTQCTIPPNVYGYAGSNSANLDWSSYGSDTRYELVYRVVGSPVSTTVTSLSSSGSYVYYALTGLTTNTAYEWQVRTVCADGNRSAFTAPQPFTTTACQVPYAAYESYVISTVARVTWYSITGFQYTVRWRLAGASVWSASATVPASATASNTFYLIAGLTSNTAYEWQVGTLCPDGTQSGFTAIRSFTTNCPVTTTTSVYNISPTDASVYWSANSALNYTVRWRPANSVTTPWNESGTLATGVYYYSLTGLTSGTTYEVQVGTVCGSGIVGYANSVTFVAQCQPPASLYAFPITDRTALLNFSGYSVLPGIRYDVQYQPQGSTGSPTMVSGIGSITLLLTSLSAVTAYTWQVRTICTDGTYSAFSTLQSFTTRTACPAMYTIRDGYWSDYSIWSCGFVPSSAHDVEIRHSVTVSSYSANQARKVGYAVGGKLVYLPGGKLQLGQ